MSLYWDEDEDSRPFEVPDDVVDLAFRVSCRSLPIDHASGLSNALHARLPWLADEPGAGVHLIHGAATGNGWTRPEDPAHDVLYPSRRTRMTLRLPRERVADAEVLEGQTLDIDGHPVTFSDPRVKRLSALPTLHARYVVAEGDGGEERFIEWSVGELRAMGLQVRKVLCGRSATLTTSDGPVLTRSLLVADLEPEESVTLQQRGLGPLRRMGCGLFVAHKGIRAIDEARGGRAAS